VRGVVLLLAVVVALGIQGCGKKEKSEQPPPGAVIQTGQVASADEIPIYYTVQGTGSPALVFVHCWSCDGGYWSEQLEYFAPHHQVVAVDLAGHGQSGLGRKDWTMPAFAEDVKAVIDKLDLHQVILIGHSMGGAVVVEAARLMPERVIGIIGVDTLQDMARSMPPDQVNTFVAPLRENFPRAARAFVLQLFPAGSDTNLARRISDDMAAAPPEVGLGAIMEVLGHDLTPALKQVQVPIHCINADYWPTNVEANQRLNSGFKVTTVSGVGHFLYLEKPEEFNKLLEEALQGFAVETPAASGH
jgi:pimeloyl-ACP methyl ester carboxylesterase